MYYIADLIRSNDMFGYQVRLNFNKNGPVHNTLAGGTFSIFINIALTLYFVTRLKVLIYSEGDTLTSEDFLIQRDTYHENIYKFEDTNLMLTPVINKVRNG